MLVGVLALISVFAASVTAVVILGKRNIFESVAAGVSFLLCLHVLISYVLFIADCFTVLRTVSTMFIISALTMVVALLIKKGNKFVCDTSIKNALIPIIVCVFLVPFVSVKNGYYGMGQDEGGYQTQAFFFMNGDTKAVHDFPVYYELSEEDKEEFEIRIDNTNGMDSLDEGYKDPRYSENTSPSERYIHGIPSFSALMATWGSIFGADQIQGVQTLIYVLLIFLTYFVTVRMGFSKVYSTLACFAVGFSPAVIWVMKSALTEGFMGLLIIFFLWLLVNDNKWTNILSIVPVAVYAMYHVSFFTIVPVFIGVYAFRYIVTAERKYIGLMFSMPALQVMSFFTMCLIQPIYTRNNYMRIFVINRGGHSVEDLDGQVILVALIYMLVISLFTIFSGKLLRREDRLETLRNSRIFLWVLRLMVLLPIAKAAYNVIAARPSGVKEICMAILKTSFYHYAIAGGIILFIAAVVLILVKPGEMIRDNNSASLSIMFFYLVLVYSSFLNTTVYPLMYFARYIVPFIGIAVIFVMYVLGLKKQIKSYITIPVFALCMCIFVPTNVSLISSRDDTKMPWEVLNSITELIDDNDAVIVAENTRLVTWMGIEARTDADVYPQYKDLLLEASEIWDGHDEIYIVKRYPMYETDSGFELVYMNTYDYQDECAWDPNVFTLYPTNFSSREETIYVYRMDRVDHREYPLPEFYDNYEGLTGYEDGYSWTSETLILNCHLEDRDYNMSVDLMPGIPFGAAPDGKIDVDVYINDELIDTVTLAPGINEEGFTLFIDDELFDEGANAVRFEMEPWDASIVNASDTRQLGFALRNITFEGC